MKRYLQFSLLMLLMASCAPTDQAPEKLSAEELLGKSIAVHDPAGKWNDFELKVYIQEPRVANPGRYSQVKLNNALGSFELLRNRAAHISKHVIDAGGNAQTYLDGEVPQDPALIKQFRLDPARNKGYRDFYQMMYGLPMTLTPDKVAKMGTPLLVNYNGTECYQIPIQLKEALFSKHWKIYLSAAAHVFQGMEIIFPEEPGKGERLYFEGNIILDGINIPRIRHWHEYADDAYSGSDIILKEMEEENVE